MKTARLLAMATGGLDIGIELESPPTPRGRGGRGLAAPLPPQVNPGIPLEQRSHSRSASWSFTRGQVLNPITTPLTSVIREIVPSLSHLSMSAGSTTGVSIPESPQPPSRASSQESLLRNTSAAFTVGGSGEGEGRGERTFDDHPPMSSSELWDSRTLGDPSANVNVHVPRGINPPTTGGIAHQNGNGNGNEEQNVRFEIGDGVRWLERNAIFIILLLVKFAWYHRSGKLK